MYNKHEIHIVREWIVGGDKKLAIFTIERYTGQAAGNGKWRFEGDKKKIDDDIFSIVIWSNGAQI